MILVDQFDTMISSERERAFLVAEMSVFSEDEFTEYCINGYDMGGINNEKKYGTNKKDLI